LSKIGSYDTGHDTCGLIEVGSFRSGSIAEQILQKRKSHIVTTHNLQSL